VSDAVFETIKQELEACLSSGGMAPSDIVGFSEPLRGALNHAMRSGRITLTELADMLGLSQGRALEIARILKSKGFFRQILNMDSDEIVYDVRMSARTRRLDDTLPKKLWDKLNDL
jgi:hypothetical protein